MPSSRDRRTQMVETPDTAEAKELAPEILDVISLVAETLLDQRRREADRSHNGLARIEQDDEGKAA